MPSDPGLGKVEGGELRRFAASGGSGRRSVLVEVAGPRRRVQLAPGGEGARTTPLRVQAASEEDERSAAAAVEEARQLLTGLLGSDPVWLAAARCFVAEVTPAQLAAIAASPLTRAVHPNRQLG